MASKNNIDQAIYQFKKRFSNTQNFDIEVDRIYKREMDKINSETEILYEAVK